MTQAAIVFDAGDTTLEQLGKDLIEYEILSKLASIYGGTIRFTLASADDET